MSDDRLQRMMDDPEAYFAEARKRALDMVARDMLRDLEQRRRERWQRIRDGYLWLAAALACFLGFLGAALSIICLDWTPWWLVAITIMFELATAACLGMSRRR